MSNNIGMTGRIPTAFGKLSKLTTLILLGCSFFGEIPGSLGSLSQLNKLSLNSNNFNGWIPASIGNLSNLNWLDLSENQLIGTIPVSNGSAPGLDMLVNAKHFHFGKNRLSGPIPSQLFHGNMTLIHLLLDHNMLNGSIPQTLGLVTTLEVVRLDWNSLSGTVPPNISDLTNITNLTMEGTQIQGEIPAKLFSLPQLQTVVLKNNAIDGTLGLGANRSTKLRHVDLENNNIVAYAPSSQDTNVELLLLQNPVCAYAVGQLFYCKPPKGPTIKYITQHNCAHMVCNANELSSPNCNCAYPYTGTLEFSFTNFSDYANSNYYISLERTLMSTFRSHQVHVDSVSLSNISIDSSNYLRMALDIFPLGQDRFNTTAISDIGFIFSNQIFKPPPSYGKYSFIGVNYTAFADEPIAVKKRLTIGAIIGIAVGGCAFLLILLYIGDVTIYRKKRSLKNDETANLSGSMSPITNPSILKLKESRSVTLEEIKQVTNNFSEANEIGSGSYGKVYRGTLNGQLIAVKRREQGSRQGSQEFRTEIELLSRVHHKNLVSLLGFCFEKDELILVYEYVPNGTLNASLSGKSGVRLDWRRRVKVALDAARGVTYLHEFANPPIIHRDIKSNNILLDENLHAKVCDFGLSRPLSADGNRHIITGVKGTMGYLDPEYYMTHKLYDKSDVYSFGVLMFELITGRPPIDRGRYILRQVRNIIDTTQDLYNLHELLDPNITLETTLKGFHKYVDLALMCVEESGIDRPAMGEVVKQLEDILEMAGMNPYSDSATSSAAFVDKNFQQLYGDEPLYIHYGVAVPR